MKYSPFIIIVMVLIIGTVVSGQIPKKISYQGFISSSAGIPAYDGIYNLRFDFYNLPTGGILRHSETHDDVEINKGSFSLILGPLPEIFSESLYVEITALAGSPGISTDLTFSPRSELTSGPYAFYAWKADTATYAILAGSSEDNSWLTDGNAGTVAGTNFVGTTDNQAFDIRTNNTLRTRITTKGQIELYNTGQSVFIGEGAGAGDDLTGNLNVFTGYRAGYSNIAGGNATAVGAKAMYYTNNTGTEFNNTNVAFGYEALRGSENPTVNTGIDNSAIGYQTLYSNTEGWGNTATGFGALFSNTTGSNNTAGGVNALYDNTEGFFNAAYGRGALRYNTTGESNTAIGYQAGYSNITGSGNVFLGHHAGLYETGSNKLYIANNDVDPPLIYGDFSTGNIGLGTTSPASRLSIGSSSQFQVNSTGNLAKINNVSYSFPSGQGAASSVLQNDGSGNLSWATDVGANNWSITGNAGTVAGPNFIGTTDNQAFDIRTNNTLKTRITTKGQIETYNTGNSVFVGQEAGANDDLSYNQNVFIGYRAGTVNTVGSFNTAVGYQAFRLNTGGNGNTASGFHALYSNNGNNNTAMGYFAGAGISTGTNNLLLGMNSGIGSIGSQNVFLGSNTGNPSGSGSGNVFIGYGAGQSESSSNKLYISNQPADPPLIYGDFTGNTVGINVKPSTATLDVGGNVRVRNLPTGMGTTIIDLTGTGVLGKLSSSRRYKTNIQDLPTNPKILDLRPVRFQWKEMGKEDIGLIAEEVDEMISDLVIYDTEGQPDAVKYDRIAVYLLSIVKEQQKRIEELEMKINSK